MKNKLTLTNLRHKLSWLLCLVAFLAVGQVAMAATWSFGGGRIYFDNSTTNWNDNYVCLLIGKSNYSSVYQMTKDGTRYYADLPSSGWTDATYMAVVGNSSLWSAGGWGPDNRLNATHYTNTYTSGLTSKSCQTFLFTPSSADNNCTITLTMLSYYALGGYLNKTDVSSYNSATWGLTETSTSGVYQGTFSFTTVHDDAQWLWIIDNCGNKWGVASDTQISLGGSVILTKGTSSGKVKAPCVVGTQYVVTFNSSTGSLSWNTACTTPTASNFTVTSASKTYTGSALNADITAADGMGTMTKKYAGSTTAPTNVGTYALTVDVAAGTTFCAATGISLGNFEITKADQDPLTFNGSTQCVGTEVTLSATGGSSGQTITYAVKSGTGTITNGKLTTNTAGTVVVTATRPGGSNYKDVTADASFIFNAAPDAPTTQGATVCSGNDATLLVTSSTTGLTIKWYSAATGGNLLETGTSYTMIELESTQTVYAEASTTTGGCASARTATTATVTPLMALTSITASATPICIGGTSNITANGLVLGGGTIAYESSSTAAAEVEKSDNNAVVTGKNPGTTTITATVSGGCKAAGDPDPTATVGISVNPNMALSSITLSKTTECIGESVTISPKGYVQGGSGGSISYSSSNTNVATVSGTTVSVVGAGSTTITATVSGGCGSSISKTQTLTGAGVTIGNPSPSTIHEYEPTTFTASDAADNWSISPTTEKAEEVYYLSTNSGASTVLKAEAGSYTLTASKGTCSSTKAVTVVAWPDKCTK